MSHTNQNGAGVCEQHSAALGAQTTVCVCERCVSGDTAYTRVDDPWID